MFNYNWVILGDTFRPLNGHPQDNMRMAVERPKHVPKYNPVVIKHLVFICVVY